MCVCVCVYVCVCARARASVFVCVPLYVCVWVRPFARARFIAAVTWTKLAGLTQCLKLDTGVLRIGSGCCSLFVGCLLNVPATG